MFFVRFVNSVGGFVVSFLSLYLTTKLGYSTALAASIVTVTVLIRIPGSLFGGILADHWNKKNAYVCTQSLSALCIGLCAFLSNGPFIIFLLISSTFFGAAVRPILNAFVYDLVGDDQRKNAYSFVYLGINFGAAIGPLFSGFLFHHYLFLFFLSDALSSFMAVFLVAFFVFIPTGRPLKEKSAMQTQVKKITVFLLF